MYEKIKADISNEYYLTNYPNDGQRFVAWYLRNIHNLDTYETKDCITDGAGDKQIDAIYIDNQSSTIYIIQGKFYGGDTVDAEPLREVLSSWVQIKPDLSRGSLLAPQRRRGDRPRVENQLPEKGLRLAAADRSGLRRRASVEVLLPRLPDPQGAGRQV